jgi:hypothetical protein
MNDIDWERAAATVGLSIIVSIGVYVACSFVGIPNPYRQALSIGLCVGIAVAFYGRRKNKTRSDVPIED